MTDQNPPTIAFDRFQLAIANESLRVAVRALAVATESAQRSAGRSEGNATLEDARRNARASSLLMTQAAEQVELAAEAVIAIGWELTRPQPSRDAAPAMK